MSDLSTLLSSALLDRGFLIETNGQDIYLTDNAFLRDDHGGSLAVNKSVMTRRTVSFFGKCSRNSIWVA